SYALKAVAGNLYQITVEGHGFRPVVHLRNGNLINVMRQNRDDTIEGLFVPRESKEYRLFIIPDVYDNELTGGESLDYTLTVKPIPMAEKPVLKETSSLTAKDPPYENKESFIKTMRFKAFNIKLKARTYYIFDMVSSADNLEPFLLLEGNDNKVVVSDIGSGG